MTMTHDIEPGRRLDLTHEVVGFCGTGRNACLVDQIAGRPPQRIEGFTIGVASTAGPSPHGGEMHPDGDELLYLISGAVAVELELADGDRTIDLVAGDAIVVPQGVWHRITTQQPGRLVHVTPGPNGAARPLDDGTTAVGATGRDPRPPVHEPSSEIDP